MKTQSAKAKGRKLQQWVRNKLLERFHQLEDDDIKSTSMGAGGEDVQLSPAARKLIPYSIECKSRKSIAVYSYMDQAKDNCPSGAEPLVVVKADRKDPLVIIDADYFIRNMRQKNGR